MDLPRSHARQIRETNRVRVLTVIRREGPLSRAEVSRRLGLSQPTVSALVGELKRDSLVRSLGLAGEEQPLGRKSELYAFNAEAGAILTLVLEPRSLTAGVADCAAEPLATRKVDLAVDEDPFRVIDRAVDVLDDLRSRLEASLPLLGLGVAVSGLTDPGTGTVIFAPHSDAWRDIPVGPELAERLGAPTYVDNIARVEAMAEKWFGLAMRAENFVALETGLGIGAGVVIDGSLYQGAHSVAGEIGHTIIRPGGAACGCGGHGCWEAEADAGTILERLAGRAGAKPAWAVSGLTWERVGEEWRRGDPLAARAVAELAQVMGLGLRNLVNAFDPELVILHGELVGLGEEFLELIREELEGQSLVRRSPAKLQRTPLGRDAASKGCAGLVLNHLFSVPSGRHRQAGGGDALADHPRSSEKRSAQDS